MVQPGRRLWSCVIKNIKANTEVGVSKIPGPQYRPQVVGLLIPGLPQEGSPIYRKTQVARVDAEGNLTGKLVIPGTIFTREGAWDENLLSAAIVMEYGGFRYYEGGDTEVGPGMDAVARLPGMPGSVVISLA